MNQDFFSFCQVSVELKATIAVFTYGVYSPEYLNKLVITELDMQLLTTAYILLDILRLMATKKALHIYRHSALKRVKNA